jgi:hypothetical protein
LFNIGISAHFDAQRLAEQAFKGRRLTRRRPQFQFCVSRRAQLQEHIVAAIMELDAADRL